MSPVTDSPQGGNYIDCLIGRLVGRKERMKEDLSRMLASGRTWQNIRVVIEARKDIVSIERRIAAMEFLRDNLSSE